MNCEPEDTVRVGDKRGDVEEGETNLTNPEKLRSKDPRPRSTRRHPVSFLFIRASRDIENNTGASPDEKLNYDITPISPVRDAIQSRSRSRYRLLPQECMVASVLSWRRDV